MPPQAAPVEEDEVRTASGSGSDSSRHGIRVQSLAPRTPWPATTAGPPSAPARDAHRAPIVAAATRTSTSGLWSWRKHRRMSLSGGGSGSRFSPKRLRRPSTSASGSPTTGSTPSDSRRMLIAIARALRGSSWSLRTGAGSALMIRPPQAGSCATPRRRRERRTASRSSATRGRPTSARRCAWRHRSPRRCRAGSGAGRIRSTRRS